MYYRISVTKDNKPYFSTHENALGSNIQKVQEVYNDLRRLYEGKPNVKIVVACYHESGSIVTKQFADGFAKQLEPGPVRMGELEHALTQYRPSGKLPSSGDTF
jgi:hypothetical protein